MKPSAVKLIGFVLAVAAALFLARHFGASRTESEERLSDPIRRDSILESVYGIGTVMANRSFQLRAGINTNIRDLFIKEGDTVENGQKLVELERGVFITAPFSGTVTSLPIKVGENVFMQTVVLDLVDLNDRYVTVSLEQRAAIRVRRGQSARLSFENLRETSFAGTVESVYSSGQDFLVRIEAPELPPQILPGMTADVAIAIDKRDDALLVPVAAIREGAVLVRRGTDRAVSVPVKTGLIDGAFAEIVSGDLQPGDRVLLPPKSKP